MLYEPDPQTSIFHRNEPCHSFDDGFKSALKCRRNVKYENTYFTTQFCSKNDRNKSVTIQFCRDTWFPGAIVGPNNRRPRVTRVVGATRASPRPDRTSRYAGLIDLRRVESLTRRSKLGRSADTLPLKKTRAAAHLLPVPRPAVISIRVFKRVFIVSRAFRPFYLFFLSTHAARRIFYTCFALSAFTARALVPPHDDCLSMLYYVRRPRIKNLQQRFPYLHENHTRT